MTPAQRIYTPIAARHTPEIELRAAEDRASDLCPHWDGGDHIGDHDCCWTLREAQRRLRRAKAAIRRKEN